MNWFVGAHRRLSNVNDGGGRSRAGGWAFVAVHRG
jgi:hypothetical protein